MFEICTLASGSSGNCLLMTDGSTHILVDAGISARRICKALRELGVEPGELAGILVTHEHTDHIAGIATLTKQLALPVYASHAAGRQMVYRIAFLEDCLHTFVPGDSFEVGCFGVESFPTQHDTEQSVGYAVTCGSRRAAVATDLGEVTDAVRHGVRGAHLLVCETNHDVEMVRTGPYPYYLKERILGEHGHLCNEDGAALALQAVETGADTVVLAHLSAENNTPGRAHHAVKTRLEAAGVDTEYGVLVEVAPRSETGRRYRVGEHAHAPALLPTTP
ncbi:MAG TPA: MBL fold metallo-hydrolase [Pseudoflavonifractor sp.]|nr:MBL fold metallo-hydrolase [Pseudoflavonifractor sp.]